MFKREIKPESPVDILPALTKQPYSVHLPRNVFYAVEGMVTSADTIDPDGPFLSAGEFSLDRPIIGAEKKIGHSILTRLLGHYESGRLGNQRIAFVSLYRRKRFDDELENPIEPVFNDYLYLPTLGAEQSQSTLMVAAQGIFNYIQGQNSQVESSKIEQYVRHYTAKNSLNSADFLKLLEKLDFDKNSNK